MAMYTVCKRPGLRLFAASCVFAAAVTPGVLLGVSSQLEVGQIAGAGLSPADALRAATEMPAQQPIFTAKADYVTFSLRVLNKGGKTPRLGLNVDDFIVKVDGKKRALSRVGVISAGTPSQAYLLAFEPTTADRDGKSHRMEVQVKGIGKVVKRTFMIDRHIAFPTPVQAAVAHRRS